MSLSQTYRHNRSKYVVRIVVGLALTTGLAAPAMAGAPPVSQSIGDAAATGDSVEVHTSTASTDPLVQQQIEAAEKDAKTARQAAHAAVTARDRARHTANILIARAYRERTRTAVNAAIAADKAAKKATARARALKQAAKKATARAAAVRQQATGKAASGQRSAIAGEATSTSTDRNRSMVMDLANQVRAAAGCDPLNYNLLLERSAQGHAQDMSAHKYMSHTSLDGRTFDQRIRAAGYEGGRIGENIGAGFGDAGAIMDAWMHSPAHKANILDCRFRNIGVGYDLDGGYWVQNFGS